MAISDQIQLVSERIKRAHGNKLLAVLVTLSLVTLILVISIIVIAQTNYSSKAVLLQVETTADECWSRECLEIAYRFMKTMNTKVKPCNDFYEFMCGNYEIEMPRPADEEFFDVYEQTDYDIDHKLRVIYDQYHVNEKPLNFSKATQCSKVLYDACINQGENDVKEAMGRVHQLFSKMTGWDSGLTLGLNKTENSVQKWYQVLAEVHFYFDDIKKIRQPKGGILYHFIWYPPLKFRGHFYAPFIWLNTPSLILDKNHDYLSHEECSNNTGIRRSRCDMSKKEEKHNYLMSKLKNFIVEVVRFYHNTTGTEAELNDTLLKGEADEIIKLEKELATFILQRKVKWFTRSIADADNNYTNIHLLNFIQDVVPKKWSLNGTTVEFKYQGYFDNLNKWLNTTDERILKNYIMLRLLFKLLPLLTPPGSKLRDEYKLFNYHFKPAMEKPRWEECLRHSEEFNLIYGKIYEDAYINKHFVKHVNKISLVIKDALSRAFTQMEWIETGENYRAQWLINRTKMIFPSHFDERHKLDNEYNEIMCHSADRCKKFAIFQLDAYNQRNIEHYTHNGSRQRLHMLTDWRFYHTNVFKNSPFYHSDYMEMVALATGLLQAPFISSDSLPSLSYGAFGTILSKLLIEHYSQIHYVRLATGASDGKKECFRNKGHDVEENFAAFLALQSTFEAYKRNGGKTAKLPGFGNFTSDQLFFMNHAQMQCRQPSNSEETINNKARFLHVLSKMQEFTDTFTCREGSNMNSTTKCSLYTDN